MYVTSSTTTAAAPLITFQAPDLVRRYDLLAPGKDLAPTSGASSIKPLASGAKLSFESDFRSKSLTVTLSDSRSGEVFRKLVFDRGGLLRSSPRQSTGGLIDIVV